MLYSGDFTGAERMYKYVGGLAPDNFQGPEALIKVWLSAWLKDFYPRKHLVGTMVLSDRANWFSLIDHALNAEEYMDALGSALMEAFLSDDDVNLWADSMSIAFKTQHSELILATFSCAIWRHGYEVYALFRKTLEKVAFPQDGLDSFDQLANMLYELRPSNQFRSVTKRLVGESNYDAMQEVQGR